MRRHPLVVAFLAMLAGIWLVEAFVRGDSGLVATGCCTLAAAGALYVALRRRRGVVVASWALAGALAGLARVSTGPPRPPPSCAAVSGRRGFAESTWRGRIDGPLELRARGTRTVLALDSELCGDRWWARQGRVAVSLREGPVVTRGDRIELGLAVEPLAAARNSTEPDAVVQAGIEGVDASARVLSAHRLLEREGGLLAAVDEARRAAALALDARLKPDGAAVARGLVMGDRGALTAADREAWADAGLAHLLAVSGMHVTMVVLVIGGAVRRIGGLVRGLVERCSLVMLGALVSLPGAIAFCLWSASPASALRATLMGSVGLVGTIIGRPAPALEALCFTGMLLLLEQPLVVHDAGFLLSMAAVAALLAAPRLTADSATSLSRPLWRMVMRLRRTVLLGIMASVAATLAALPITVVYFGRVSLVAPATNLLAVPIGATIATPLALAVVAVAPWAPKLADLLAAPLDILLAWLLAIVHLGARLPGAAVSLPAPRPFELALYAVALGCGFAAVRLRRARRRYMCGCVVAIAVLAGSVASRSASGRPGELVVTLPYVGQGDAVLLRFPSGDVGLVDAGGALPGSDWDPGRQVVAPLLRKSGVSALALAVVSHPHPDHIGGFAYVASRFPIRELWYSGQLDEANVMQRLLDAVTARGGTARPTRELAPSIVFGGVRIEVVHPWVPETGYFPELGLNDNSVVLRLTHGARSILLTGDIEALAEDELVRGGASLAADILKVPHHGSRTSSSDAFLEAVRPRLAVASCGAHNQFGFPHTEVVRRFAERGIPMVTTEAAGAIELRSDGVTWRVSRHRGGPDLPEMTDITGDANGD